METMLEEKAENYGELLVRSAMSKLRESKERAEDSIEDIKKRTNVNLEKVNEYIREISDWIKMYPNIAPDWKDMKLAYDKTTVREKYKYDNELKFLDPVKILQELRNNIMLDYQLLNNVESLITIKQKFYPILNINGFLNGDRYLEEKLNEYRNRITENQEIFIDMRNRLKTMINLREELGIRAYFSNPVDEIDYDRGQRVECISLKEDRVGEVDIDYDYDRGWVLVPFVSAK